MIVKEHPRYLRRHLFTCFLLALIAPQIRAAESANGTQESPFAPDIQTVLFLGDSNTYNGHYIAVIEAQLRLNQNGSAPTFINLGLQSETASGLSEPKHPFPRPCVHERLDRALSKIKPDLVIACYGMNDAIYAPLDASRQQAYEDAMTKLIGKILASGAKCIVLTPPAFDPLPMKQKGKLQPAGKSPETYMWSSIYESYDQVMKTYSDWLKQQASPNLSVIDLHTPLNAFMQQQRATTPTFTLSGDGVHVNEQGHRILAYAVLDAWGIPRTQQPRTEMLQQIVKRQHLLRDAWLAEVGHLRPNVKPGLPIKEAQRQAAAIEAELIVEQEN